MVKRLLGGMLLGGLLRLVAMWVLLGRMLLRRQLLLLVSRLVRLGGMGVLMRWGLLIAIRLRLSWVWVLVKMLRWWLLGMLGMNDGLDCWMLLRGCRGTYYGYCL
jgi:hypothetical protein